MRTQAFTARCISDFDKLMKKEIIILKKTKNYIQVNPKVYIFEKKI